MRKYHEKNKGERLEEFKNYYEQKKGQKKDMSVNDLLECVEELAIIEADEQHKLVSSDPVLHKSSTKSLREPAKLPVHKLSATNISQITKNGVKTTGKDSWFEKTKKRLITDASKINSCEILPEEVEKTLLALLHIKKDVQMLLFKYAAQLQEMFETNRRCIGTRLLSTCKVT